MRRPPELRACGLTQQEYKLIGEIVVLCGLIEDMLRYLPLFFLEEKRLAAAALTVHMNFRSLCDSSLTILDECINEPSLRKAFKAAIKKAERVYDNRNKLVHGPFWAFPRDNSVKGTFTITARGVLKPQGWVFNKQTLKGQLAETIDAFESLQSCRTALLSKRGRPPPEIQ